MEKITHAGDINLGTFSIPCYVTDKGQRLLSSRQMQKAIGAVDIDISYEIDGKRMDRFFGQKSLKPLFEAISDRTMISRVRAKYLKKTIVGYKAELLPEICEIMLRARRDGQLIGPRQKKIAAQCEILASALARVGIIALVDEATGYQEIRDKQALQTILDNFLLKEYAKWAKRFPDEFYKEIFRLRGWQWRGMQVPKPSVLGRYTNDIVYERLAPGILDELRQRNPKNEAGNRRVKHTQFLTDDIGHPALQKHLHAVITLMRIAPNWNQFKRNIERAFPKYVNGKQYSDMGLDVHEKDE